MALDSALEQSYQNIEVILVNDGSTDNTDEVVKSYLSDSRLIYIKQNNAGQAIAKNNGVNAATGDFIAFLDADDVFMTNKIELQLKLFEDPEVGVVYSAFNFIDDQNIVYERQVEKTFLTAKRGWILEDLFLDNFVPFSTTIVRRECFTKVGLMDASYRMGIDWDLWLRMAVYYKFDYIDVCLLSYRKGHSGQMSKNYQTRAEDTARIMDAFLKNNPDSISVSRINLAYAYSYCNRGYRAREHDIKASLILYGNAIKKAPLYWPGYYGFVKACVNGLANIIGMPVKKL
jgi:glycosyltransferase involved in cell wall biosynthesis